MTTLAKIEDWSSRNHPRWLDIFRIILGGILLWKGYDFAFHRQSIYDMVVGSKQPPYSYALIYYKTMVLMVGGVLIMTGTITRIACAFILPLLTGAIIFYHESSGFYTDQFTPFWLLILLLVFTIIFLIDGSGPWSLDEVMKREIKPDHWDIELDKKHLKHL